MAVGVRNYTGAMARTMHKSRWGRCESILLFTFRATSSRVFRLSVLLGLFFLLYTWVDHVTTEQVTYILQDEDHNNTSRFRVPDALIDSWNRSSHRQCVNRTIAMGTAVSFRYRQSRLLYTNIVHPIKSPFFTDLLSTFCATASENYCYTFYVAYDYNDPVLSLPQGRYTFINSFRQITAKGNCQNRLNINVKLVPCNYTGQPARSQNEAMMMGYKDNMEYYFMVNDDTYFVTKNWAELLTEALYDMSPPNVGTTGPTHEGGNTKIMTYNFAHRTHIDIFGYFYPPEFTTWSADSWIDGVYRPLNSLKHPDVHVIHLQERGTRYRGSSFPKDLFTEIILRTRKHLAEYVAAKYPRACWFYNGKVTLKQLY